MSGVAKKLMSAAGGGGVSPTIFVLADDSTIVVVDVTDPTAMSEVSRFATGFTGTGAAYLGTDPSKNLLFMSWGDNSHVIDTSDLESLSTLGSVNLGDGAESEIVADALSEIFFVPAGDGLFAVSYATPASPSQLDLYSTVGTANVSVVDTDAKVAYVTSIARDELISLDYSTPTAIALLDTEVSASTLDGARYMALSPDNNTLFVAATIDDEISSFNVSNPAALTYLSNYTSTTFMNNPRHVFYNGTTSELIALSTIDPKISILDVSNPSSMALNGSLSVPDLNNLSGAAFFEAEQVLFVSFRTAATTYPSQVVAFDVSNSSAISVLGTLTVTVTSELQSMALSA